MADESPPGTPPVEFVVPDGTPLQFANSYFAQTTSTELHLAFFQMPYDIPGGRASKQYCLGRFVVSFELARQLHAQLGGLLDEAEKKFGKK